jgi:cytochrome c
MSSMISRYALAAPLAFALAACGSQPTPSEQPGAEATPAETASAAPEATPAASETPAIAATATPSPSPSPSPKPSPTQSASSKPAASAAATVAAASPPDAFKQCSVCHSTEPGTTIIGPSLAGVYGTKAGEVAGFKFSDAMKNSGLTWNAATLDKYLADPKGVVPGTLMSLAGIKDADQRAAIIAYLKTLK